nr:G protein-activated inward rectifier potassium channel 3-like isoform X3 [Vanessa tameamea]
MGNLIQQKFHITIIKRLTRRFEHDRGSRDRDIIACDASGGTRAPGDDGADDRLRVSSAHDTMHADPESPASREEAHLLPDDWLKIKTVPGNGNLSPGVYYPTVSKRSRSHRHGASRRTRRRAILKNGECNILKSRISQRRLRFLQDMFTTLVDAQWRWTLLVFTLSFILSWLGFALIWWLIAFTHGDLEPDHLPPMQESTNWKPCVFNIFDFTSCFLFSIETQHTIGYGARTTTEECPEAIFIMCLQSIVGVMIQAFMVGIVFAKMTRPKHRTQTLLFSKYAVICQRDGELCLMFRVGDLRKSHIIGASVRAQLIRSRTTKEGELLSHYQTELELHADGCDSNLFFIWPITMVHRINADSPFYGVSAADILQEKFEIVVILEGTIESTGQTTQARSSYTTSELMWGHRFVPLVTYNRERQGYEVDYSKFEETTQVDTPLCSAKELDEFYGNQADRRSIGYMNESPLPGMLYGKIASPLTNIADRLVVDAIRRASLTNKPSVPKYPHDFFNGAEEPSSSSSEDEKKKEANARKNSKQSR